MHSDRKHLATVIQAACAASAALTLGGCMMQNQSAPALAGPSGFGLALTMAATPDIVPRDGSSQSTIHLNYRDGSTNAPLGQRRVTVSTTAGTLSVGEVVTDAGGNATFTFTAPSLNTPVSTASVTAVPVGDNIDNARVQLVTIALLGPDVPSPAFTFTPNPPVPGTAITFDASATKVGNAACAACSYQWDFGDGSSATGDAIVQHVYVSTGVIKVTLTVHSPEGTSASTSKNLVLAPPSLPIAQFEVTPASPTQNVQAAYDGSGSSVGVGATIVQYDWSFDDGGSGVTPIVLKSFSTAGTHIVTLTVTDSLGRKGAVTKLVTVVP
jgi:PKD repeat protein